MRTCKTCGVEKDEWDFRAYIKNDQQYVNKTCIECRNKEQRKQQKDYHLQRKYIMSEWEWEMILKLQDNKCKICGKEFDGQIQVDHDHKTMVVRGLLCPNCNNGLGKFHDDPTQLRIAANYLETAHAIKELYASREKK